MTSSWQLSNLIISEEDRKLSDYAFYMWYLQENADLTYREARVILKDLRKESFEDLKVVFNCSIQNIYNIERRGLRKINDAVCFDNKFT